MFKHHGYPKAIILQAVYFKLRFTLSYRDVEELLRLEVLKWITLQSKDGCLSSVQ